MRVSVQAVLGGVAAALVCATVALLLIAPTAVADARAQEQAFVVPSDLSWRYATSCDAECADRYELAGRTTLSFVDGYDRARLWDWYRAVTLPCLAERGIDVAPVGRDTFFGSRERPWNPYVELAEVPFDDLVAHYRACPPIPPSILAKHVPA